MQKTTWNTKKKFAQDMTRKTEGMFLETWKENKNLKDNVFKKDESYQYSSE